jgi:hypothetical protein
MAMHSSQNTFMAMPGAQNAAPPIRGPSVQGSLDDIDPVLDRLFSYSDRLQKIRDRLRGPTPSEINQAGQAGNVASAPQSIIASINRRRSRLVDVADVIESAINNIEESL